MSCALIIHLCFPRWSGASGPNASRWPSGVMAAFAWWKSSLTYNLFYPAGHQQWHCVVQALWNSSREWLLSVPGTCIIHREVLWAFSCLHTDLGVCRCVVLVNECAWVYVSGWIHFIIVFPSFFVMWCPPSPSFLWDEANPIGGGKSRDVVSYGHMFGCSWDPLAG